MARGGTSHLIIQLNCPDDIFRLIGSKKSHHLNFHERFSCDDSPLQFYEPLRFDSTSNKLEIKLNFPNLRRKGNKRKLQINRYDIRPLNPSARKSQYLVFPFAFANIFNLFDSKCFANDITCPCISGFLARLQTFVIKISICLI